LWLAKRNDFYPTDLAPANSWTMHLQQDYEWVAAVGTDLFQEMMIGTPT
jgi:hypothetical protein